VVLHSWFDNGAVVVVLPLSVDTEFGIAVVDVVSDCIPPNAILAAEIEALMDGSHFVNAMLF
jgi:hypothetical protein